MGFGGVKQMTEQLTKCKKKLTALNQGKLKPLVSYEMPEQSTLDENDYGVFLAMQWICKMDLPGSNYYPMGMNHFSDWFWALILGNYDDFMEIVRSKSESELAELLKRRESCLQLSAIFLPVMGAQTFFSYSEKKLEALRKVRGKVERKYMQILRELLVLGADVNDRDSMGYTPLHFCVARSGELNEVTCFIMEYLLQQGANPDTVNRIGLTPLMQSISASENKMQIIDLLLTYNADPLFQDNSEKISPYTMSSTKPEVQARLEHALNKRDRKAAKEKGHLKTCCKCKQYADKRCTGCFLTWYCGKDCQLNDWKHHVEDCKKIRANYKEVTMKEELSACLVGYDVAEKEFTLNPKSSHFVLEIQLPGIETETKAKLKPESELSLLCMDKDEDVVYKIPYTCKLGAKLKRVILKNGSIAMKNGYFYSIVENGKHYINPTILPPETWGKFRQYIF